MLAVGLNAPSAPVLPLPSQAKVPDARNVNEITSKRTN